MARADRRDLILKELEDALATMDPIILMTGEPIATGNIVRNRNQLPAEKTPGIILLDADETRDLRFPQNQGRGGPPGSGMMIMRPEVYVVLDVRQPPNKNVGQDLDIARAAIIATVLKNKNLQLLTGSGGVISYDGCITDLARNRQMKGQMGLMFSLGYPFIPGEFKDD